MINFAFLEDGAIFVAILVGDTGHGPKVGLEFVTILSEIVEKANQLAGSGETDLGSCLSTEACCSFEVSEKRLLSAIRLAHVGDRVAHVRSALHFYPTLKLQLPRVIRGHVPCRLCHLQPSPVQRLQHAQQSPLPNELCTSMGRSVSDHAAAVYTRTTRRAIEPSRPIKLPTKPHFVASSATEVTKSDLAAAVAKRAGLPSFAAETIVDEIFASMVEAFQRNDDIYIRGFGSFLTRHYKGYLGRNPKTGAIVKVARKRLPVLVVSREMRERVNARHGPAAKIVHSGPGAPRKSVGITGEWDSIGYDQASDAVDAEAVTQGK
jgi:integration host factor subunit beta